MNYDEVVSGVCSKHLINESILMSKSRQRWICAIRHEAMHELKEAGYTLEQIGSILNRDHTSVMYGIKKHLGTNDKIRKMPPANHNQRKLKAFECKLKKIKITKGSINKMVRNYLSEEVLEYCLSKVVEGRYLNLSEYFADVVTDAYFSENKNEQR